MTQKQLGIKLKRSGSFVSQIERGQCCLSVPLLQNLSEILDVSTDYLIFGKVPFEIEPGSLYDKIEHLERSERYLVENLIDGILTKYRQLKLEEARK